MIGTTNEGPWLRFDLGAGPRHFAGRLRQVVEGGDASVQHARRRCREPQELTTGGKDVSPPSVTSSDTQPDDGRRLELRRRLRHACVLLGAAEVPTGQRKADPAACL
ncbi:MAG: hypothetical protein R3B06_03865 [Kofleriaceae bacterium]